MNPKGTLSIQLLDFNNPSGKDYSGSCCDCCGAFGWCPNDCENFFQIFVASYPLSIFSFFHAWKRWETYVLGDDSFTFPGYGHIIGKDGLRNPLTYHFDGPWPVRYFSLSVFLNCLTFYGIRIEVWLQLCIFITSVVIRLYDIIKRQTWSIVLTVSPRGGGGYSWEFLVGVCCPVLQILTWFQTKKCNFPHPFSDQTSIIHTRFQTWPLGRNYVIIT